MAKFKDRKELFEYFEQLDPLTVFQTEHGYLKLTERQKAIIRKKRFTPGRHVFASITGPDGIQCLEVAAGQPGAFKKFVEEHEARALAYAYLGVADEEGKVAI